MTITEFIKQIKNELESEYVITINTKLEEIPEYDSFGVLTIISVIDENFGVAFSAEELKKIQSIQDLVNKIGKEKFEN